MKKIIDILLQAIVGAILFVGTATLVAIAIVEIFKK